MLLAGRVEAEVELPEKRHASPLPRVRHALLPDPFQGRRASRSREGSELEIEGVFSASANRLSHCSSKSKEEMMPGRRRSTAGALEWLLVEDYRFFNGLHSAYTFTVAGQQSCPSCSNLEATTLTMLLPQQIPRRVFIAL